MGLLGAIPIPLTRDFADSVLIMAFDDGVVCVRGAWDGDTFLPQRETVQRISVYQCAEIKTLVDDGKWCSTSIVRVLDVMEGIPK